MLHTFSKDYYAVMRNYMRVTTFRVNIFYIWADKKRRQERKFFEIIKLNTHTWNTFNIIVCEKNPCHHTQLNNSFYQLINLMFLYTVKHYLKDYERPFTVWKKINKFLTNTTTTATVSLILKFISVRVYQHSTPTTVLRNKTSDYRHTLLCRLQVLNEHKPDLT